METLPAVSLVVDNAHIHPKHAWATSQLHHHVSRISSCPDIQGRFAPMGGVPRVSSTGTLCRWGAGDTSLPRVSSTGSFCRWGGSSSTSLCGMDTSKSNVKTDGALRKPQRRSADDESVSSTGDMNESDNDFGDFVIFLDDEEDEDASLRLLSSIEWHTSVPSSAPCF